MFVLTRKKKSKICLTYKTVFIRIIKNFRY